MSAVEVFVSVSLLLASLSLGTALAAFKEGDVAILIVAIIALGISMTGVVMPVIWKFANKLNEEQAWRYDEGKSENSPGEGL